MWWTQLRSSLFVSLLSEELRSRQFWRAMLAELLGTLVLVSTLLGASVPGPGEAPGGPLYSAVAVGVVIVALAHCFGEISGAQVNVPSSHVRSDTSSRTRWKLWEMEEVVTVDQHRFNSVQFTELIFVQNLFLFWCTTRLLYNKSR